MTELNRKFELFARKMKAENLPDIVIENFRCYYNRLAGGETGLISEKEILPMDALADIQAQPEETLSRIGGEKLHKAVIIKLNGGLGTSMGMQKAKSLLKVKDGYSFLDIIVRQIRYFDCVEDRRRRSIWQPGEAERLGCAVQYRQRLL